MSYITNLMLSPLATYSLGFLVLLILAVLLELSLSKKRYSETEKLVVFFNSIFLKHRDRFSGPDKSMVFSLTGDTYEDSPGYIGMKFFSSENIFEPSMIEFFFAKDEIASLHYEDFTGKKFSVTSNTFYLTSSAIITRDILKKAYAHDKGLDVDKIFSVISELSTEIIKDLNKRNKKLINKELDAKNGFFIPKKES